MSKELTEQWRNGTLPRGYYYYKTKVGVKVIGFQIMGFKYPYNENYNTIDSVEEVLAPVPTYDQFSQMVKKVEKYMDMANKYMNKYNDKLKKVEKLEQQLEEAEEVIRLYFKNTQNATYQTLGMNDGYYKKAFMHTVAKEYLEKYGVDK